MPSKGWPIIEALEKADLSPLIVAFAFLMSCCIESGPWGWSIGYVAGRSVAHSGAWQPVTCALRMLAFRLPPRRIVRRVHALAKPDLE